MKNVKIFLLIAASCFLLSNPVMAQAELSERRLMDPTGWYWLTGVSPGTIKEKLGEGYRIFDIEVDQVSPIKLSVVMVKNSGVHRKGWWWYYGLTGDEVSEKLDQKKARLLDIETYRVNGRKRYAVVMVSNQGDNRKGWWYYTWRNFNELKEKINEKEGRLFDFDTYTHNGERYFSGVMVPNKGSEAKSWWYYSNLTADEVKQKLREKNARLTDIEVRNPNGSPLRFSVVMERLQGETWWWYYGKTLNEVKELYRQRGARIIDVERYKRNGKTRYAVILLRNINDQSEAMRTYLSKLRSGGSFGFYLKQVDGRVKASLQETKQFYPASTIKILEHVHSMLAVQAGTVTLNNLITKYPNSTQSCADDHTGHTSVFIRLETILRTMMEDSDNQSTNALQEFFGSGDAEAGRNAMNTTARNVLGVSKKTKLHHKLGCGGSSNDPANTMTLRDLGKVYEEVNSGLLTGTDYANFDELMQNIGLNSIINQEAAALGLSNTIRDTFKANVATNAKAGSVSSQGHYSIGGWVSLPMPSGSNREFVFGVFVDDADSVDADFDIWDAARELLRPEINRVLARY